MATEEHHVAVVGAGVAGIATALALHRIGVKCIVLEQVSSLRTSGAAFIMWPNAWSALENLGVAKALSNPYHLLHGAEGILIQTNSKTRVSLKGKITKCVERSDLLEILAKALPEGTIRFNSKLISLHATDTKSTKLILSDGTFLLAKVVIGCDGVHSAVARWLGLEEAKSTGRSAIRGIAKYPKGSSLEKLVVVMMGAGDKVGYMHCKDDEVYWFITRKLQPSDALIYSDLEKVKESGLSTVSKFPRIMTELLEASPKETYKLAEIKIRWVWPWRWETIHERKETKSVVLAGDAFHPVNPDVAQGACLALEDAVVLAQCFADAGLHQNKGDDWSEEEIGKCLEMFRERRKWRVFFVAGVAYFTALVQEGCCAISRFVRDWLYFPIMGMSTLLYSTHFRCQPLPTL